MKARSDKIDHTGRRYHRLVVVDEATPNGHHRRVNTRCDCGKLLAVRVDCLVSGNTQSCGCLQREAVSTHGLSQTAAYIAWDHMHERCYRKHASGYKHYGARGITVEQSWHDFKRFIEDMGQPPTSRHSLDRIDVNGIYSKENCRWATTVEQARNRRNNRRIEINGVSKLLCEWAEFTGLASQTISRRLSLGWSERDAVLTPVRKRAFYV